MSAQPLDAQKVHRDTGATFAELMAITAAFAAQNQQSLLRWLSTGTGAAIALAVTWISTHTPAHPRAANLGVCMLLVCFLPALLAELVFLSLLPAAETRKKGWELAERDNRAGRAVDRALLARSFLEAMPPRARAKWAPLAGDDFASGRWHAGRLRLLRVYVWSMVIGVPVSISVLVLSIIGLPFC